MALHQFIKSCSFLRFELSFFWTLLLLSGPTNSSFKFFIWSINPWNVVQELRVFSQWELKGTSESSFPLCSPALLSRSALPLCSPAMLSHSALPLCSPALLSCCDPLLCSPAVLFLTLLCSNAPALLLPSQSALPLCPLTLASQSALPIYPPTDSFTLHWGRVFYAFIAASALTSLNLSSSSWFFFFSYKRLHGVLSGSFSRSKVWNRELLGTFTPLHRIVTLIDFVGERRHP